MAHLLTIVHARKHMPMCAYACIGVRVDLITPPRAMPTARQGPGMGDDSQVYLNLEPHFYLRLGSGLGDTEVIPYNPLQHIREARESLKEPVVDAISRGGGAEKGLSCETVHNDRTVQPALGMYGDISSQPTQASPASRYCSVLYSTLLYSTAPDNVPIGLARTPPSLAG